MNPHLVLLPILIPLAAVGPALLLRRRPRAQAAWSLGAMLMGLLAGAWLLGTVWRTGQPVILQLGGWPAPFGIALTGDLLSATMAVMSGIVLCLGFTYAMGCRDRCITYPHFYPLFLTLAAGLTGVFLTGDIFNLFVFAELLVISGAGLTAISDDPNGAEAAYKYFFMSLMASVFLLIAVGSLYVAYGTLNMADLAQRIAAEPARQPAPLGMALLFAFFMVKSAVVPFHFWQPDFHAASPTPVSAMLSSVVVKVGVYGFIRMTTLWFAPVAEPLKATLIVLGVVGVIFGGFTALGATHAKRMLAYSTLGQIGFILVAIGWGTPAALAAAIILTFNHSLIKSAMLMLAGAVASRASVKSAAFETIAGVGKSIPFGGVLFFIGALALAGVPPTNGFVGKLALFGSGVGAAAYPSLLLIGVASIMTLMYVIRAFQVIWWQPPAEGSKTKPYGDSLLAPAILIGLCVLLGLWSEPLARLAIDIAEWIGDPTMYIASVLGAQ
jgi:multicomponent Na+:H+ antiporter subunit D